MGKNNTPPSTWDVRIPVEQGLTMGETLSFTRELELPEILEYFGVVFSLCGNLEAKIERLTEGRSFWTEINVVCKGSVPCSRCLKETPLEIVGSFRYFYTPSAEGDGQADDEMIVTYPPDAVEVDLSGQIWESLVMSLPEKVLCRDECAGLCPKCGADLNLGPCGCPAETLDPRLQALKDVLPGVSED